MTAEQRTYLIGKQAEAEKMSVGAPRGNKNAEKQFHQNEGIVRSRGTAGRIAEEHGTSYISVERAERFAKGLDAAETVFPGIRESVLSGEVKAPKNLISEIRNIPEEHRTEAVEAIKRGDTDTAKQIIKAVSPKKESVEKNDDDRPAYNADDGKYLSGRFGHLGEAEEK